VIRRCAWCGGINPGEQSAESISDGICEPCMVKHYPSIYERWVA
jgi:hypothetical protein